MDEEGQPTEVVNKKRHSWPGLGAGQEHKCFLTYRKTLSNHIHKWHWRQTSGSSHTILFSVIAGKPESLPSPLRKFGPFGRYINNISETSGQKLSYCFGGLVARLSLAEKFLGRIFLSKGLKAMSSKQREARWVLSYKGVSQPWLWMPEGLGHECGIKTSSSTQCLRTRRGTTKTWTEPVGKLWAGGCITS
jgi:hypothetical protein